MSIQDSKKKRLRAIKANAKKDNYINYTKEMKFRCIIDMEMI